MKLLAVISATVIAALVAIAFPTAEVPTAKVNSEDGLEYVWIPPGEFWMGAIPGDEKADDNEKPRHRVRITRGFWLSRVPVTVGAYRRFVWAKSGKMPSPPDFNSAWAKEDHPIVNVTWFDATEYCNWVEGRLPTEAEWEYAARGGKEGFLYPWGNDISPDRANYRHGESGGTDGTSSVGNYEANGFGLYDMAGNVWEWVQDVYTDSYYQNSPEEDPEGPPTQMRTWRVLRGGSLLTNRWNLRVSYRSRNAPGFRVYDHGFRCAEKDSP